MVFRTAGAITTLLIGLGASAGDALAQYYPPAQAYPPPQAHPPAQGYPPYRPLPPVADADDNQIYDLQGRPLPPAAVEPAPGARYGRGGPVYPDEAAVPPPAYRDPPPQGYREQSAPQGYEPAIHTPNEEAAPKGAEINITPDEIEGSNPPLKAADISIDVLFDSDYDGVPDDRDLCPNTPPGLQVDANGCSKTQIDHHGVPLPRKVDLQFLPINRGKNGK